MDLKIGVVVHGPGIIDSGYAIKIINILSKYGSVSSRLGGTMGRTAVIDASLENIIDISRKLLPSQSIKLQAQKNDVVFLLNYGKSNITGHTFGYKVFKNTKDNINLIQIERPGEDDGVIISWSDKNDTVLLDNLSNDLNLPVIKSYDVIKMVEERTGFELDNNIIKRKVAGVSPDENIMINGIIVGKVTSDDLTIIARDNKIIKMHGAIIKQHGLDKLGDVDLSSAVIKTGLLRKSSNVIPRKINKNASKSTAVFLNHAASDLYKYMNEGVIVSIGDDTTLLSSDIMYRFNIPVIGITDGDLDKVVEKSFKLDESLIIQVESGYDDIVGQKILNDIFSNNEIIKINSVNALKQDIISVIEKMGLKYNIVKNQL